LSNARSYHAETLKQGCGRYEERIPASRDGHWRGVGAEAAQASKEPSRGHIGTQGRPQGGAARAANLTPEQRSRFARAVTQSRWKKQD